MRASKGQQKPLPPPPDNWATERDSFGLFKHFDRIPLSHSPETVTGFPLVDLHQAQASSASGILPVGQGADQPVPLSHPTPIPQFHPYPNWSSFELGDLLWNRGPINSLDQFRGLVGLLKNSNFSLDEIRETNWDLVHERLVEGRQPGLDPDADWIDDTGPGWTATKIVLQVPFPKSAKGKEPTTTVFDAGILHHRKIVSVIKEKLGDPQEHRHRHFQAHQVLWQPSSFAQPVRVYGEVYSSDEFRRMEAEVQNLTLTIEENQGLERVVLALMFWTDATLLANFGTAKLWPCYLFFGNDSKYLRGKPSANLCNHVAYFESLPDNFKDWYRSNSHGRNPTQDLITHCNREIFHRQWDIILDEELLQAMKNGLRIRCPDNVVRLFFPRIFTYSADYPEKALIATIRALGASPCPRCLVKKCDMHEMGGADDLLQRRTNRRVDDSTRQEQVRLAKGKIFDEGYVVNSTKVDDLLKADSMLPIENAFSKLTCVGFNIYSSLVVDLMHEFELGVWKAVFIHLVRILEADDRMRKSSGIHELDQRYRQVPSFGPDTIRKFSSNVSERKRLAARDYANLLQCAIPVFDGLLPEPHNAIVLKLLLLLGEWHALAKLRMHTELTVGLLEIKTGELANQVRTFIDVTCQAYETVETAKEYSARLKRSASKKGTVSMTAEPTEDGQEMTEPNVVSESSSSSQQAVKGKRKKTFNIQTYKYHALADFADHIRQFGTTDSYSTARGELEHKLPKSWFPRTNKKQYRSQLARIERRRANLRKIRQNTNNSGKGESPSSTSKLRKKAKPVQGRSCSYVVAKSQSTHEPIARFVPVEANNFDPALKDFVPNLQDYVCRQMEPLLQRDHPERFAQVGESMDKSYISFVDGRIYTHQTLQIRYSSYDTRQGDDIIWPSGSKGNIMLPNPSFSSAEDHPLIYGKVLGIYHANVVYVKGFQDLPPKRFDFLWVRWYTWQGKSSGTHGLDIVAFPPLTQPGAFGFVHPGHVLRACHIIPRFSVISTLPYTPPVLQVGRSERAEDVNDYASYFINRLADRDMFMRYQWGHAVGHCYTHGQVPQPYPSADAQDGIDRLPDTVLIPDPGRSDRGTAGEGNSRTDNSLDDITDGEDNMIYERSDVEVSDEEDPPEEESDSEEEG